MSGFVPPKRVVTVDVVVLLLGHALPKEQHPSILLIQRGPGRFADHWALPGGMVEDHQTCELAAALELFEETGIEVDRKQLRLCHIASDPGRDSLGPTVSVVYRVDFREMSPALHSIRAGDDAKAVQWVPLRDVLGHRFGPLAFDHYYLIKHSTTGF